MELRPFYPDDAAVILSWLGSERELLLWSGPQYGHYPVTPQEMIEHYAASAPDLCPFTAVENGRIVGHLILRRTQDPTEMRLGDIIVDNRLRGQHVGSRMIRAALALARDSFGVTAASLGVYLNNPAAHRCYLSIGFVPNGDQKAYAMMDEPWTFQNMRCIISP